VQWVLQAVQGKGPRNVLPGVEGRQGPQGAAGLCRSDERVLGLLPQG